MKYLKYVFLICLLITNQILTAQNDDIKVLSDELMKGGQNYYNYSDKNKENFEIILLGGVANPGKYLIPQGTTLLELISYAGKPVSEDIYAYIKIIRSVRPGDNSVKSEDILRIDYKSLFSKEPGTGYVKNNPLLKAGDIVVFPLEKELSFWDYVKDVALILTPLISIASLIISITRNN